MFDQPSEPHVSLLLGGSATGKSFMAAHYAMCIATGRPFFGRAVVPGQVRIIQFDPPQITLRRMSAWVEHYKPEQLVSSVAEWKGLPDQCTGPSSFVLEFGPADVTDAPLRLIILDPVNVVGPLDRVGGVLLGMSTESHAEVCAIVYRPASLEGSGAMKRGISGIASATEVHQIDYRPGFQRLLRTEKSVAPYIPMVHEFGLKPIELTSEYTTCVVIEGGGNG